MACKKLILTNKKDKEDNMKLDYYDCEGEFLKFSPDEEICRKCWMFSACVLDAVYPDCIGHDPEIEEDQIKYNNLKENFHFKIL